MNCISTIVDKTSQENRTLTEKSNTSLFYLPSEFYPAFTSPSLAPLSLVCNVDLGSADCQGNCS